MSRLTAAVAVAMTVGLLAACGPVAEDADPTPSSSAAVSPAPAPTPTASVPVAPATPRSVVEAPDPVALRIDALGVDMPIQPVGVQDSGAMEIPEDPAIAGWYRFGPAPADPEGATVLAAHVDDREYGVGPLARLRDAQAGETVIVRDAGGAEVAYAVESVAYIPRAQLPVAELFERTGPRTLVVVTCGGQFDERTRSYSDNVVLVARALP